jgi:tight adherence protein C
VAAGIRLPKVADVYFLLRILTPLLLAAGGWFVLHQPVLGLLGAIAGYVGPSFLLDRLVKRYTARIRRAMPDVVDMLVVCVDAGLGIDPAMLRTAREIAISYPEVSYELLETNRQRQAGFSRQEAWENLIHRTKLEEIETMVSLLNQADELGIPIKVGLRNFSDTLRKQRRNMARTTAARAGVLLLIPIVLFIFPTVFIVIMGPAVLTLMKSLSSGIVPQ